MAAHIAITASEMPSRKNLHAMRLLLVALGGVYCTLQWSGLLPEWLHRMPEFLLPRLNLFSMQPLIL